jgi:hypothetical protein
VGVAVGGDHLGEWGGGGRGGAKAS